MAKMQEKENKTSNKAEKLEEALRISEYIQEMKKKGELDNLSFSNPKEAEDILTKDNITHDSLGELEYGNEEISSQNNNFENKQTDIGKLDFINEHTGLGDLELKSEPTGLGDFDLKNEQTNLENFRSEEEQNSFENRHFIKEQANLKNPDGNSEGEAKNVINNNSLANLGEVEESQVKNENNAVTENIEMQEIAKNTDNIHPQEGAKKTNKSALQKVKHFMETVIAIVWNIIRCGLTGLYRTFKFTLNMLTVLLIVAIIGGGILFARYHSLYTNIRQTEYERIANLSEQTFSNLNNTRIYDNKGKLMAEITAADYEYIQINKVSKYIQEGYISVEDKNFKNHIGFDIVGIARAGVALVKNNGNITQGGSTITQQVVKNTLLTSEQTYVRKCAEILLAVDLEKKFTKAQIMEFYVNSNFYGNQCYGVEAACQYYFGKSASDVSISEAAMIVAISNSPSKYNPVANYDLAIERRNLVLDKMLENGVINNEEYEIAKADNLLVVEKRTEALNENYQVSYAIYSAVITLMEQDGFEFEYVFEDKESYDKYREKYSEAYSAKSELVRSGGFDIYTSLNTKQQKKLQKSVDSILSGFSEKQDDGRYAVQGAAVCVDNETGYVTAIVGGRGKKDQYNRAYLAKRQPGSTIKPLIDYAPAFESGEYYPSKIMVDKAIKNGPRNSGGSYRGRVSMRDAIARSINTIAYQTLQGIGVDTGLSYLGNMRFNSLTYVDNNNLTISIGGFTNGVRVVDMAKGYSTLAAGGTYIERTCIRRIDKQGEGVVYTDTKTSHDVFLEDTAWLMTDCLKGTMELSYGTGRACALDGQISAGKTGTTNDSKDGWFCGYTTRYTTAVWVGRDDNKGISGMYGATYAGKIWQDYMNKVHKGLSKEDFTKPDTVKKKYVGSDGAPTANNTGKKDYFSDYAENKRSLLLQAQEEAKAIKKAEKIVSSFENFYIEKVEDCFLVEEKYNEALSTLINIVDADKRVGFSTRIADKYAQLKNELKNWEDIMAAYEIEQARIEQEAQRKAEEAAKKARIEKEKSLAITRFNNALAVVKETTDVVTDYTYQMLELASAYLSECVEYSEYDALLEEYVSEKQRIEELAKKNVSDAASEAEQEAEQAAAMALRKEKDKQRVEEEKREKEEAQSPESTPSSSPQSSTSPDEDDQN